MKIEQKINKDLILREKLALQRTILANQTTLLAFLRTAMYFLVAAVSIRSIIQEHFLIEVVFYVISGMLFLFGLGNYFLQNKKIKQSRQHIGNYKDEYLQ